MLIIPNHRYRQARNTINGCTIMEGSQHCMQPANNVIACKASLPSTKSNRSEFQNKLISVLCVPNATMHVYRAMEHKTKCNHIKVKVPSFLNSLEKLFFDASIHTWENQCVPKQVLRAQSATKPSCRSIFKWSSNMT